MRCKVCLKKPPPALKRCSQCKSVYYCSSDCQRIDWNKKGHRKECQPKEADALTVSTAFGDVSAAEIAARIFEWGNSGGGGGGGGAGRLISKVVAPCPKITRKLLESVEFREHKEKIFLHEKDGKLFIDILAANLVRPNSSGGEEEVQPSNQHLSRVGNSGPGADRVSTSTSDDLPGRNFGDLLLLSAMEECMSKAMHYAVERSVVDYIEVVQSNLVAMRGIMAATSDESFIDNISNSFFALHGMEISGLILSGRVATSLEKFEEAEKWLNQAEKAVDRIGDNCAQLLSSEQRDSAKFQIEQLRQRLPMRMVPTLRAKWVDHQQKHQLTEGTEKVDVPNLEAALILRDLGIANIRMGDVEGGQIHLMSATCRMYRVSELLAEMIEIEKKRFDSRSFYDAYATAFEACALYVTLGEAGYSGAVVFGMQSEATAAFAFSRNHRRSLEGSIRLWNWNRNGRVFLRRSVEVLHPQFAPRLEQDREPEIMGRVLLQRISENIEEFPYDDKCTLCEKELSWTNYGDDGVEILVKCKHSYHKSCLDLYVEDHEKECPQCFVAFFD